MGDGDGRLERDAARPANSAVEPACNGRSAKNDDCDAGAECGARDAAICRAAAVSANTSRASLEENKRRASGGG